MQTVYCRMGEKGRVRLGTKTVFTSQYMLYDNMSSYIVLKILQKLCQCAANFWNRSAFLKKQQMPSRSLKEPVSGNSVKISDCRAFSPFKSLPGFQALRHSVKDMNMFVTWEILLDENLGANWRTFKFPTFTFSLGNFYWEKWHIVFMTGYLFTLTCGFNYLTSV